MKIIEIMKIMKIMKMHNKYKPVRKRAHCQSKTKTSPTTMGLALLEPLLLKLVIVISHGVLTMIANGSTEDREWIIKRPSNRLQLPARNG